MLGHSAPLGTQVRQQEKPCPPLTRGTERAGVFVLLHPVRLHSSQVAVSALDTPSRLFDCGATSPLQKDWKASLRKTSQPRLTPAFLPSSLSKSCLMFFPKPCCAFHENGSLGGNLGSRPGLKELSRCQIWARRAWWGV